MEKTCKNLSFNECNKLIIAQSVIKNEKILGRELLQNETTRLIINIVEDFIREKELICYGGTAINALLPKSDKFYDYNYELPDYDFFSYDAMENAKELTDIYFEKGINAESKSGMHKGTYKVYANFMSIADITQIHKKLYEQLKKESIKINGIHYCSPNFLRMALFVELSRPKGEISRWEKIYGRLLLLNKNYPVKINSCINDNKLIPNYNIIEAKKTFTIVKNILIKNKVIFFGGYAMFLYSKYFKHKTDANIYNHFSKNIPDFDIIYEDAKELAFTIAKELHKNGVKNIKIVEYNSIYNLINTHYQIKYNDYPIVYIFKPISCHSYNTVKIHSQSLNIATIDTILSFYLAFLYADEGYFDKKRILCYFQLLFNLQQDNLINNRGLLKRFNYTCYGNQESIQEILKSKALIYKKYRKKRQSKIFKETFFTYKPANIINKVDKNNKTAKNIQKKPKVKINKTVRKKNK